MLLFLPRGLDKGLVSAGFKSEAEWTDDDKRDNTLSSRRLPNGDEDRGVYR